HHAYIVEQAMFTYLPESADAFGSNLLGQPAECSPTDNSRMGVKQSNDLVWLLSQKKVSWLVEAVPVIDPIYIAVGISVVSIKAQLRGFHGYVAVQTLHKERLTRLLRQVDAFADGQSGAVEEEEPSYRAVHKEGMHKAASKLSLEYLLRVVSQPYRRILLVL